MRNWIKLILCLILLLFFREDNNLYGQRIIEYKGDTLIAITPQNVTTINSIIVERNYLEKEVLILNDLNNLKDSTIWKQNQIITTAEESILQLKKRNELVIQEQAYTQKRKIGTWSGISAGIGFLLGILLIK